MLTRSANKGGRPRKYADDAERQRAYRKRRGFRNAPYKCRAVAPPVTFRCVKCNGRRPCRMCLWAWNALLAKFRLQVSRGMYMTDAPHGMGLLVSGGYDRLKIEQVFGAEVAVALIGGKKKTGANNMPRKMGDGFLYGSGTDPHEYLGEARGYEEPKFTVQPAPIATPKWDDADEVARSWGYD